MDGMLANGDWKPAVDDYQILEPIGSGTSATVYKAMCRSREELCAIKIIPVKSNKMSEAVEELVAMSRIHHSNLIHYHTFFYVEPQNKLYIVMPLLVCSATASIDALRGLPLQGTQAESESGERLTAIGLPEPALVSILYDVLRALEYLHTTLGIVHRDIKGSNILLAEDGAARVSDMGVVGGVVEDGRRRERRTVVGSPCWMAPEVIETDKGYDEKVDIWSLGITALELASGEAPYCRLSPVQAWVRIVQFPPPTLETHLRSLALGAHASHFTPTLSAFIACCLQRDPSLRPSAQQLLKHEIFSEFGTVHQAEISHLKTTGVSEPIPTELHQGVGRLLVVEHIIQRYKEWFSNGRLILRGRRRRQVASIRRVALGENVTSSHATGWNAGDSVGLGALIADGSMSAVEDTSHCSTVTTSNETSDNGTEGESESSESSSEINPSWLMGNMDHVGRANSYTGNKNKISDNNSNNGANVNGGTKAMVAHSDIDHRGNGGGISCCCSSTSGTACSSRSGRSGSSDSNSDSDSSTGVGEGMKRMSSGSINTSLISKGYCVLDPGDKIVITKCPGNGAQVSSKEGSPFNPATPRSEEDCQKPRGMNQEMASQCQQQCDTQQSINLPIANFASSIPTCKVVCMQQQLLSHVEQDPSIPPIPLVGQSTTSTTTRDTQASPSPKSQQGSHSLKTLSENETSEVVRKKGRFTIEQSCSSSAFSGATQPIKSQCPVQAPPVLIQAGKGSFAVTLDKTKTVIQKVAPTGTCSAPSTGEGKQPPTQTVQLQNKIIITNSEALPLVPQSDITTTQQLCPYESTQPKVVSMIQAGAPLTVDGKPFANFDQSKQRQDMSADVSKGEPLSRRQQVDSDSLFETRRESFCVASMVPSTTHVHHRQHQKDELYEETLLTTSMTPNNRDRARKQVCDIAVGTASIPSKVVVVTHKERGSQSINSLGHNGGRACEVPPVEHKDKFSVGSNSNSHPGTTASATNSINQGTKSSVIKITVDKQGGVAPRSTFTGIIPCDTDDPLMKLVTEYVDEEARLVREIEKAKDANKILKLKIRHILEKEG